MSPQGVYPTADVCVKGDEISSTFEGRHVTLYANNLEHGDGVSYVTKGYPVWFGDVVGIPFATQDADTGNILITIDTEGIWCVDVEAKNDAGNSAVIPGDKLYINTTDNVVSKLNNVVTQIPFGYALGNIAEGLTERIAVKVHFDPAVWTNRDMYATLVGTTSDNAFAIDVTDEMTIAGGMNRALAINYDCTGLQTGTAQINALSIDMSIADDVNDWMMLTLYNASVVDKNVEIFSFISMYSESLGSDVAHIMLIDVGMNWHDAPAGRECVIRCRQHDTLSVNSDFLRLEGANALGYLVNFTDAPGGTDAEVILDSHTDTETSLERIRCRIPAGDRYIYLYPV